MPRPPRADVAGEIYHALNRGNGRMTIFHKDADYEAFERVLNEGLEKYPVSLIAYQWMPNHWRKGGCRGGSNYAICSLAGRKAMPQLERQRSDWRQQCPLINGK